MSEKVIVLNPLGFPPKVTLKSMAPRLEGLEGKLFTWSIRVSTTRGCSWTSCSESSHVDCRA